MVSIRILQVFFSVGIITGNYDDSLHVYDAFVGYK